MRYRLLESRERGIWSPIRTVFESGGEVLILILRRSAFAVVAGVQRLEDLTLEHVVDSDDPRTYRLSEIREVEFPEHEIQRKAKEMRLAELLGCDELPDELVAENHIDLLRSLRQRRRAAS